jgi:predicted transposase YdaD
LFELDDHLSGILRPYLPRLEYALLDLSQYDPATQERNEQLRIILQLMKMAREQRVLEFFEWLAGVQRVMELLPEGALEMFLLYALHVNKHLDVESVAYKLRSNPQLQSKAMSLAEHLIEQGLQKGRQEGRQEGVWAGKLTVLQELMNRRVSSIEELAAMSVEELQARYLELDAEYKQLFKK